MQTLCSLLMSRTFVQITKHLKMSKGGHAKIQANICRQSEIKELMSETKAEIERASKSTAEGF